MASKSYFDRNIPCKHFRKQPYPMRSPDSSGDGFVYRINIYETYLKNPNLLLNNNPFLKSVKPNIDSLNEIIKKLDKLPINHQNLNFKKTIVKWKKSKPMEISQEVGFYLLHEKEKALCSDLRLTPSNYLNAKYNILNSALSFKNEGKEFKKINAQKYGINFDVNKASCLWDFFRQLEWF